MNKVSIYDIVRKHFPENEYALMQEVRNAAGFNASRSADYVAMNLWPSRGLSLNGIEQKSFRSDWTKELKQPEKADAIFKYCDYWWLLTTADNVAKIEEIPEQWGWLHIVKDRVKIIKQAPKLTPCVMDRGFLACILKRACNKDGYIKAHTIQDKIEEARQLGESSKNYRLEKLEENLKILNGQISEFRKYTGIEIGQVDSWRQPNMEKIGGAVNSILKGGKEQILRDLNHMEANASNILKAIQTGILSMKDIEKEPLDETSRTPSLFPGS